LTTSELMRILNRKIHTKWDETALSVEVINGDFLHLQMSLILHCLLLWSEINGDFLQLQIFCILNLEIAC